MTKRFQLQFTADNAAFDGGPNVEIVRILREVADRIESGDSLSTDTVIGDDFEAIMDEVQEYADKFCED